MKTSSNRGWLRLSRSAHAALLPLLVAVAGLTATSSASAAQGGWSGNHYWIKVTNAEVARYGVGGACAYALAGNPAAAAFTCPLVIGAAGAVRGGTWAEAYPGGYSWSPWAGYRYFKPYARVGSW